MDGSDSQGQHNKGSALKASVIFSCDYIKIT